MKHYTENLSAYLHHELPADERQLVAEHLLLCADCRAEHDRIKLGAAFAASLERSDAPAAVWNRIKAELDGRPSPQMTLISRGSIFGFRDLIGYAVGLVVMTGLVTLVYFTLLRTRPEVARTETEIPAIGPVSQSSGGSLPVNAPVNAGQANNNSIAPNSNLAAGAGVASPELAAAAWQFQTISGLPKVGTASGPDRLAVGDTLETDAVSRARIAVADIGSVDVEPNSRVKLVGTDPSEHRISLERGVLQAKISAPPRLFIVDTPSAVAVDLGCEYRLEVDRFGNSRLNVTKGFVALERSGRESIVPAGVACLTKRGGGLGTPFAIDTTEAFRKALERFDFAGGGSRAVDDMLDHKSFYDMVTLWHLLARVSRGDREKVFEALSAYVKPPGGVSREGVLRLDKKMLGLWRTEVERVWFE